MPIVLKSNSPHSQDRDLRDVADTALWAKTLDPQPSRGRKEL